VARFGLPRSRRLLNRRDFDRVFRRRCGCEDRCFAVYGRPNRGTGPRLGIVVSRRVSGRAVDRNRIKRVIREAFRHNQDWLDAIDVVVVARSPAAAASRRHLEDVLKGLWKQLVSKCKKP
jgi:ribonuclease P protein component